MAAARTPVVVGLTRDAAAASLIAAGYASVTWLAEPGHRGPAGSVVRQEPAAGGAVQPRAAARLVVAR